jgi:hypothetical protein
MTTDTATETAPATTEWVALANLSISRAHSARHRGLGDDRMADRVERGERVRLTEDEAHGFLTRHRVPVIRKATEADSGKKITARDLFGRRRPGPPTDALTDVTESTQLIEVDPALSPEGNPPDPSAVDPDADNEGAKGSVRGKAAKAS